MRFLGAAAAMADGAAARDCHEYCDCFNIVHRLIVSV